MSQLDIINPKRKGSDRSGIESDRIFPYYAGYSYEFVSRLLASAEIPEQGLVVDPWNGGGTTTASAREQGLNTVGFDLNPAMVIVARAKLLSPRELPSLLPLLDTILHSISSTRMEISSRDPLLAWFSERSAVGLRAIERSVHRLLGNSDISVAIDHPGVDVETISGIAAFFYVACFRTTRRLIAPFAGSNPTWIRCAKSQTELLEMPESEITNCFQQEVERLLLSFSSSLPSGTKFDKGSTFVRLGNAESIPLDSNSTEIVLTSPPYCTRIDYAVATLPELAVLGFQRNSFNALRRSLTGTSTVSKDDIQPTANWGKKCKQLLTSIQGHPDLLPVISYAVQ